jgi:hypothetical protein
MGAMKVLNSYKRGDNLSNVEGHAFKRRLFWPYEKPFGLEIIASL